MRLDKEDYKITEILARQQICKSCPSGRRTAFSMCILGDKFGNKRKTTF